MTSAAFPFNTFLRILTGEKLAQRAGEDERTAYVANKARSMAFFICIYVQLAASMLAILVFDQVLVGQVLCGLTCLQGLLYTVFYWHYDKVY